MPDFTIPADDGNGELDIEAYSDTMFIAQATDDDEESPVLVLSPAQLHQLRRLIQKHFPEAYDSPMEI